MRFGIVGCGHIAKKHKTAILELPQAELVAVCDKDIGRLDQFLSEDQYSPVPKKYVSLESMLASNVDVVCICTPSGMHTNMCLQAAEAKKHIIVEKPIALNLKDADAIILACRRNKVKLAVVHPNRFRPAAKLLRQKVLSGSFGELGHVKISVLWNRSDSYYAQASWRGTLSMDGGVMINQAIHNIDLMLWMFGNVEEVSAYQSTRIRPIEAEDTSVAIVRFESGLLGLVEASVNVYPDNFEESISVFGENGSAVIGGKTANWIKRWEFADESPEEKSHIIQSISDDPFGESGFKLIIQDMIEAIYQDRKPLISGEDGRKALEFVVACGLSAEKQTAIGISALK